MAKSRSLYTYNRSAKKSNSDKKKKKKPNRDKKPENNNNNMNKSTSSNAKSGIGMPENNVKKPHNGFIYVNEETADTFVFFKSLGWISLSGFYPDVGEGAPDKNNPPAPMTGDQYVDILTGDFYVFTEGLGWKANTGVPGPAGPPGQEFTFNFVTTVGPDGPVLSGPFTIKSGSQVQMWTQDGKLYADVV